MIWKIKYTSLADKNLEKLNPQFRKIIKDYLDNKVLNLEHPKQLGKALVGKKKGLWRYRVEKFRIICKLEEHKLIILIVKIAKRDVVYDD